MDSNPMKNSRLEEMGLAMKTEYWDDPKALCAFKEFMLEIHGLDFSEWESGGYWDDAYTPFSFFKRVPRLKELYPYIAGENDRVLEFHFYTDKLGLDETKTRPLIGNKPFVKGRFPVERPVFPFTSRA